MQLSLKYNKQFKHCYTHSKYLLFCWIVQLYDYWTACVSLVQVWCRTISYMVLYSMLGNKININIYIYIYIYIHTQYIPMVGVEGGSEGSPWMPHCPGPKTPLIRHWRVQSPSGPAFHGRPSYKTISWFSSTTKLSPIQPLGLVTSDSKATKWSWTCPKSCNISSLRYRNLGLVWSS